MPLTGSSAHSRFNYLDWLVAICSVRLGSAWLGSALRARIDHDGDDATMQSNWIQ